MSDEDGHVSLFNSNHKFASSATHQENTGLISLLPVDNPNFFLSRFNTILSCVCFKWNLVCVDNARFRDWTAHNNAVFDVSWIKVRHLLELCIICLIQ